MVKDHCSLSVSACCYCHCMDAYPRPHVSFITAPVDRQWFCAMFSRKVSRETKQAGQERANTETQCHWWGISLGSTGMVIDHHCQGSHQALQINVGWIRTSFENNGQSTLWLNNTRNCWHSIDTRRSIRCHCQHGCRGQGIPLDHLQLV